MKREEKNQLARQRILDSAKNEFSEKGYGASSINTICANGGISKGILYYYFPTKDAVYLECVKECFNSLTAYIRENLSTDDVRCESGLKDYFSVRLRFFHSHPIDRRIFCDAVIMPPTHLQQEIKLLKQDFDRLNVEILSALLSKLSLRTDVSKQDVIDTFRQYQDFINAKYQMSGTSELTLEAHEESCFKALNILLYGIVERK